MLIENVSTPFEIIFHGFVCDADLESLEILLLQTEIRLDSYNIFYVCEPALIMKVQF